MTRAKKPPRHVYVVVMSDGYPWSVHDSELGARRGCKSPCDPGCKDRVFRYRLDEPKAKKKGARK